MIALLPGPLFNIQPHKWSTTQDKISYIIFTQPLRSGRIWHKVHF